MIMGGKRHNHSFFFLKSHHRCRGSFVLKMCKLSKLPILSNTCSSAEFNRHHTYVTSELNGDKLEIIEDANDLSKQTQCVGKLFVTNTMHP